MDYYDEFAEGTCIIQAQQLQDFVSVASQERPAEISSAVTFETSKDITVSNKGFRFAVRGTAFSSIFILLSTIVGAGTLSLPFAFAQGGIVYSSVVLAIVMVTAIHVGTMIFATKRYVAEVYPGKEVWNYVELADAAYGTAGKIVVLFLMFGDLMLVLTGIMIFARDQLQDIISLALFATGHVSECSPLLNCGVLMCIAFLPVFPVILLRNLTPLQFTTFLSIICVSFVAMAMTVDTAIHWSSYPNVSIHNTTIQLFPVDFVGSITALTYCSSSFICHFNLLRLQKELKKPATKLRFYTIIITAMLAAYFLYNVVVFAGYFRFFDTLKENVMLNYSTDNYLITAARVAMFVTLVTVYPVIFHPTREFFNNAMALIKETISKHFSQKSKITSPSGSTKSTGDIEKKYTKIPAILWFCETCVLFAVSFLSAAFIKNVGLVWNLVASLGSVQILYIFPSAFYLKIRFDRYKQRSKLNNITIWSQYTCTAVL